MAPHLQAKLLRVLEERSFRRLGGTGDIHVDVRVIAATNRDPEEMVKAGTLREDLFYRLNVLRLELPPLRARDHDVALLAQHFVEIFSREFKRPVRGMSRAAEAALLAHRWPGNVRELRNLVERGVLLSEGGQLEASDFETLRQAGGAGAAGSHGGFTLPPEGVDLEEVERSLVVQALERSGGNQTRAAALLSLHRDQIRYRVDKYGLNLKT
jgi:transcriptional regulator with PAS, ATPase and Fis domain